MLLSAGDSQAFWKLCVRVGCAAVGVATGPTAKSHEKHRFTHHVPHCPRAGTARGLHSHVTLPASRLFSVAAETLFVTFSFSVDG